MPENLNQDLTTDVEENLFDDISEEDDGSLFEDESSNETDTETETPTEEVDDSFMTIKFLKEDKKLSKEEAIAYAQKGMNYDRIYEDYQALKGQENVIKELGKLAQLSGMSVEDYLSKLNTMQTNLVVSKEVENLRKQYPNADDGLLKDLATRIVNEKSLKVEPVQTKVEPSVDPQKEQLLNQLKRFEEAYPNVDASTLNDEVYKLMDNGYTLLEAYNKVESLRVAQENKIKEKNESNKRKSLGNINNAGNENVDDFLGGFFSD